MGRQNTKKNNEGRSESTVESNEPRGLFGLRLGAQQRRSGVGVGGVVGVAVSFAAPSARRRNGAGGRRRRRRRGRRRCRRRRRDAAAHGDAAAAQRRRETRGAGAGAALPDAEATRLSEPSAAAEEHRSDQSGSLSCASPAPPALAPPLSPQRVPPSRRFSSSPLPLSLSSMLRIK